jgi:hypothetical protein
MNNLMASQIVLLPLVIYFHRKISVSLLREVIMGGKVNYCEVIMGGKVN